MSRLQAPFDRWAEEAVVGCAVASKRGAALAAERLDSDDFYNPRHARLFAAAVALESSDQDERVADVSRVAEVDQAEVERLVDARPVAWDRNGSFAARVLDASRRRQIMATAAEVYNAVAAGARLEEIAPLLRTLGISA